MSKCGFSIVDLKNMINIIEVCTKRGAFNAEEISGVGNLYDRLKVADKKHSEKVEENVCPTDSEEGNSLKPNCCDGEVCPTDSEEGSSVEPNSEEGSSVEPNSEEGSSCDGGVCPIQKDS
jgi:hypothetical protein